MFTPMYLEANLVNFYQACSDRAIVSRDSGIEMARVSYKGRVEFVIATDNLSWVRLSCDKAANEQFSMLVRMRKARGTN